METKVLFIAKESTGDFHSSMDRNLVRISDPLSDEHAVDLGGCIVTSIIEKLAD